MSVRQSILRGMLVAMVGLAACSAPSPTPEAMVEPSPEAMMEKTVELTPEAMTEMAPEATMEKTPEAAAEATMETTPETDADARMGPDWLKIPLTSAVTRETFVLADWHGKVVLVETMAVWCPKCLQQQKQVKALHEALGARDDFASVGLGVDPNEDAGLLGSYVVTNGFDWTYAVAPAEVARAIAELYGDQFLNPPSTPMLIIDRHGEVHVLPFGIKSAEQLQDALEPFLNESL